MLPKRKNPNYKLKVKLLEEVQLKCPFCAFPDASRLEHHHIDGNPSNTIFENLISVCPNCHSGIESGIISKKKVVKIKASLFGKSQMLNNKAYTFDNFRIHDNRVGIFKKGMTVNDIYTILPSSQIRKSIIYGEHSGGDMYDSYEIYDSNGEHLLSVETSENGNINSEIEIISIKSSKFHTLSNVKIGARISEIAPFENISTFEPDIEQIHFKINWLNVTCSVNKKQLKTEWWNDQNNRVYMNESNLESKIDNITIFWKN